MTYINTCDKITHSAAIIWENGTLGLKLRSEVKSVSVKQMAVFIRWQIEISRGLRPLDPPWGFGAARRTLGGVSMFHTLHDVLTPRAAARRRGICSSHTLTSDVC